MSYEFETTILGGFPVLVEFEVDPSDPEVGILSECVDEYQLCSVETGKPFGPWLEKRLKDEKGEDALLAECLQHVQAVKDDAEIQRGEDRAEDFYFNH